VTRPKPAPPQRSWEFDYWGVTGLGRHRTIDGQGNIVGPPKPWRNHLGVLAFNVFFWGMLGLVGCAIFGMPAFIMVGAL
jgi:hypothetical protein